jgi:Lyase
MWTLVTSISLNSMVRVPFKSVVVVVVFICNLSVPLLEGVAPTTALECWQQKCAYMILLYSISCDRALAMWMPSLMLPCIVNTEYLVACDACTERPVLASLCVCYELTPALSTRRFHTHCLQFDVMHVYVYVCEQQDTVCDRDFVAEYMWWSSLTLTHLSQLAEDLIIMNYAKVTYNY